MLNFKKIKDNNNIWRNYELIKKSILAKAFRGELRIDCEEDESDLELLKEILINNKIWESLSYSQPL